MFLHKDGRLDLFFKMGSALNYQENQMYRCMCLVILPFPWGSLNWLGIKRFLHTPKYDAHQPPWNLHTYCHRESYRPRKENEMVD